jgi:hypothetical protein
MLAVLEDGIRNALSPHTRERDEADAWITNRRQRSPFAFNTVCETFGLEPDAVRRAVARLRAKQVPGRGWARGGRARANVRQNRKLRA